MLWGPTPLARRASFAHGPARPPTRPRWSCRKERHRLKQRKAIETQGTVHRRGGETMIRSVSVVSQACHSDMVAVSGGRRAAGSGRNAWLAAPSSARAWSIVFSDCRALVTGTSFGRRLRRVVKGLLTGRASGEGFGTMATSSRVHGAIHGPSQTTCTRTS